MDRANSEFGVITTQPVLHPISNDTSYYVAPYQGPAALESLVPLTFMYLKRDNEANCCSTTTHYNLLGHNKEILLKGTSPPPEFCQYGRSPIAIQDLQGRELIRVQIEQPADCCSSSNEVEISAPPGNPVGSITIQSKLFSSDSCQIESNVTGGHLYVETKTHFFSGYEHFFKRHPSENPVAVVKCERNKFRLEIFPETYVDPTMKANLIGFMLMLDVFQSEAQQQQT